MMEQVTREMNKMRERVNALDLQSSNNKIHVDTCCVTVDHLETLVMRNQDRHETVKAELDAIRRAKLEKKTFDSKVRQIEEELKIIKIVLENSLNEFKAIENFTSK